MNKYIICFFSLLCIVACKKDNVSQEYMAFEKIIYKDKFPTISTINEETCIPIDAIENVKNFEIFDSLIFVDTNKDKGLLDIININTMRSYGKFLNKGNAKNEFSYGINITLHSTIEFVDDTLVANIYDPINGHIISLNVSKTISDGKLAYRKAVMESVPHSAFWTKTIGDTLVLSRYLDEMETKQIRKLCTPDGDNLHHDGIGKLNGFEIPLNEDFNIMSTLMSIHSGGCIAEALIGMNYINIYSINNERAFTICVGKEMDRLSNILSTSKYNRKYVFADIRTFDFGFGVLKFDITEKEYESDDEYHPAIIFFDWQGNAIGEVKSEIKFNHFDYDEFNNDLYILDSEGVLKKTKVDIHKYL